MRARLTICLLLLLASLVGTAPAAAAPATWPIYVGSLTSLPERNAAEAPTMKIAMVELNWRAAQPDSRGRFNDTYLRTMKAQVDSALASGRRVVLGFGFHYSPAWVLAMSRYVNQNGVANTTKANLVFSYEVRLAMKDYIRHVDQIIPLEDIWAARLNATGNQGEVGYPDNNYWAYSTGAQNGADMPGIAPNPLPGWKTGTPGPTREQIENWARWYQGALSNLIDYQHWVLDTAGFRGWLQLIMPGSGLRPSAWTATVDNRLAASSLLGRGVAWNVFAEQIRNRKNIVLYTSSMAEASNYNVCEPSDRNMALRDPAANSWSAGRWISRVAGQYGMRKGGEIPGYNDGSATYYNDPGPDGLTQRFVRMAKACNFNAAMWAHDPNLWANNGAGFKRLSTAVDTINGGHNPPPPFPS
jgi:hypothetical protein